MRGLTLVAVGVPLLAGPVAAQDFRWHGTLAAGKTIEVRGILGPIRATAAGRNEVEVTATRHAKKGDPGQVEIRVVEHADGVTICAVYPSARRDRDSECRPGGGEGSSENSDVEVAFEVRVPAGVRFSGSTVSGDVTASGLTADARLSSVNGDVEVETRGLARASTVNGSIRVVMGRSDWDGELRLSTVNGGITVTLPSAAGADLTASTVNGNVESDFPITVRGRVDPRTLRGRIGEGGRDLRLATVNGSIRLRRAG